MKPVKNKNHLIYMINALMKKILDFHFTLAKLTSQRKSLLENEQT